MTARKTGQQGEVTMERDFVFRLGPLDKDGGAFFIYYVYPGEKDNYAFPAADDQAAFLRILESYDAGKLSCEEALSEMGAKKGIPTEPFDQDTAHALALMAYDYLPSRPMDDVRAEGLVYDFAQAAKEYLASPFARREVACSRIDIFFHGEPDIHAEAWISVTADPRQRIRLVLADDAILARQEAGITLGGTDDTAEVCLGIDFVDHPQFAVNAMERAHELDVLPLPVIEAEGKAGKPNDLILVLLITALTGIARLAADRPSARGIYRLGRVDVAADLYCRE